MKRSTLSFPGKFARRLMMQAARGFWILSMVAGDAAVAQSTLTLQPGSTASTLLGMPASTGVAGMAQDQNGNTYFADKRNHRVLRRSPEGVVSAFAGSGRQGFAGDGGPATAADLNGPSAVAVDAAGAVFIADTGNGRVRRVDGPGIIRTVIGDGGPAAPTALAFSPAGDLYLADARNHCVRRLARDGSLTTVAGSGEEGDAGDGMDAKKASFREISGLAVLPDGRLLVADSGARRLRVVQVDGTIEAYTTRSLRRPGQVATDTGGGVWVADAGNHVVVELAAGGGDSVAAHGALVVAGSGWQGSFTAGDPLLSALDAPAAALPVAAGGFLIGDRGNRRVESVELGRLSFGVVPAGQTSYFQLLTIQGARIETSQVTSLSLPRGFSVGPAGAGDCPALPFVLAAGERCGVPIVFAPTAQGVQDGVARVTVAGGAPQRVLLTGTGAPGASQAASSTALSADGSIAYAGSPVTLTARVSGPLGALPGGTMSFLDGTSAFLAVALERGAAAVTTRALSLGTHSLRAAYSGDAVYAGSRSEAVTLTVVATPDFTLGGAAARYSSAAGGRVEVPLVLLPVSGTLHHPLVLSVAGLPPGALATFAPSALTLGGDPANVALSVQLPAKIAGHRSASLPAFAFACVVLAGGVRRRRAEALCAALLMVLVASEGCGGGFRSAGSATISGSSVPTSSSYSVTVTATTTGVLGDALVHTTGFTLLVTA